ncbi:MAG: tetratricopeptide repeat protein [Deltaproteobacteria bacterium]|nr:tetratricopeptide repeat protein [Deltaproteobacteria bacterium]
MARRSPTAWPVALSALLAATPLPAKDAARTTVAVAPFTTSSTEEYWWLGFALADAMEARLARSPTVNTLTVKQWSAVLRDRDLPPVAGAGDIELTRIGKLLGARFVVSASYLARWPDLKVMLRVIDTTTGKSALDHTAQGFTDRLGEIEGALAVKVFELLRLPLPAAPIKVKDVLAFRAAMLCKETAMMQSLSPRAVSTLPASLIEQARGHCERALVADRSSVDALTGLGILQAAGGDTDSALATLRRAQGYARRPGLADLALFWVRVRSGQLATAIDGIREAVAKRPGYLHARGVLGQALNEAGRYAEAKQVWLDYLAVAPGHPYALTQLGYTLARLGDFDGAIARTDEALAQVPDDPMLLIERASRQIDAARWSEAETSLRRALETNPQLAIAYLRLGYVYLQRGQLDLARPILQKALAEADLESERRVRGVACFDLAKVEARSKKFEAALALLDQAVNEGYARIDAYESDPDFRVIRVDPRFQALLQRLRAGKPASSPAGGASESRPARR